MAGESLDDKLARFQVLEVPGSRAPLAELNKQGTTEDTKTYDNHRYTQIDTDLLISKTVECAEMNSITAESQESQKTQKTIRALVSNVPLSPLLMRKIEFIEESERNI